MVGAITKEVLAKETELGSAEVERRAQAEASGATLQCVHSSLQEPILKQVRVPLVLHVPPNHQSQASNV